MKIKLSTSDWLTIVLFFVGITIGCYQSEFKQTIERIMERWRIILLVFSVAGLVFVILKAYLRTAVNQLKDIIIKGNDKYLEEIHKLNMELQKKQDKREI